MSKRLLTSVVALVFALGCAVVNAAKPSPSLPTLSIGNFTHDEGNIGVTPFTFTVTLSPASTSTVTASFATADGTAKAGSDYVAVSGTLTFNPGVTTRTITVNVISDTVVEPNETFFVKLSAPTNATIGIAQGTGTIVNDDHAPQVGTNVNMVTGTKWPFGDPLLTKQNEIALAKSSINPQRMLGASNDYRLVFDPNEPPNPDGGGDAWIQIYKSTNGGGTWTSTPLGGCPLNIPACNDPKSAAIKGLAFAADPTMRPGPYNTFFLSFIAANRGTGAGGVTAIQRFLDLGSNVKPHDDPFKADVLNSIAVGTKGQFKDKSWNGADRPNRPWNGNTTCTLEGYNNGQPVPAFNHYISFSNFTGQGQNEHPQILVARSRDCGLTYDKAVKVSESLDTNSGSVSAIDPVTGALYVFWRRFGDPANSKPDGIYFNKSTDGGTKWASPKVVTFIAPIDQGATVGSFRTNDFPTAAISVDALGNSRIHVMWAERKAPLDAVTGLCTNPVTTCDARIAIVTSTNGGATWSPKSFIDNWTSDLANPVNPGRGHQVQPALTFAGGKLAAVWIDQRLDHTIGVQKCSAGVCSETRRPVGNLATTPPQIGTVFWEYLADFTPPGQPGLIRRHTVDVYGALADANGPFDGNGNPTFISTRVSQYPMGVNPKEPGVIQQLRVNPPNLPIFSKNTLAFLGDYIDIAGQVFQPTGNPSQPYQFNVSGPAVFNPAWTDMRDVMPPNAATWENHTHTVLSYLLPPGDGSGGVKTIDCDPTAQLSGGSWNQNVYMAVLAEHTTAYANLNAKVLDATLRGFVVTVQNLSYAKRAYRLTLAGVPTDVTANFAQDLSAAASIQVIVGPRSSATRTVWVNPNNPSNPNKTARIQVNVDDWATLQPITQVVLNPDPKATQVSNADLTNVDLANNDLTNVELTNVELTNVDLSNVDLANNELANVELTNVDLANVDLANADLANVDLANVDLANVELTNNELTNVDLANIDPVTADLANVDLANNDLANNDLTNADLANGAPVDASFTLTNSGNTDTTIDVQTLLRDQQIPPGYKAQFMLHKVSLHPVAALLGCKIAMIQQHPHVTNMSTPFVTNTESPSLGKFEVDDSKSTSGPAATVPMLPGERAQLTLRIHGPTQPEANAFGAVGEKFAAIGAAGSNTPAPLIIKTLSLTPVGTNRTTSQPVKTFGGKGLVTWSFVDPPPPWLSLSPTSTTTGSVSLIADKPPTAATYTIRLRVVDQSVPKVQDDEQVLQLIVTNNP